MKITRRSFLYNTMLGTAGVVSGAGFGLMAFSGCDKITKNDLNNLKNTARNRERRIIMNNDGNDINSASKLPEVNVTNLLKQRSHGLVGTQVDTIFYCTGVFNLYSHQSEESELHTGRDNMNGAYLKKLASLGTDPLKIVTDFGHGNGFEVFWSMRMNDTHDSSLGSAHLFAQWKKDHPEYLVGKYGDKFSYGANRWSSVNYDIPEVREKVFRILQDVCSRYDVDGIELDFFRHPVLFKQQMTGDPITQSHCDKMTALMQKIRDMTVSLGIKRQRPFLIAVRLPDSVEYCKAMGIDLIQWLEDDLVDIVTGADYFKLEPWENLASLGKKYNVPVYACLEGRRIELSYGHPTPTGESLLIWRGEALNAWEAGVNGIYTFNRFNPHDRIFREIGDPELLKRREYIDRTVYVNKDSWSTPGRWLKNGADYVSNEIKVY